MSRYINTRKGFTLIELLVVIAIIAILSAVILVNVNASRVKANDGKVKQQLHNMQAAIENYYYSTAGGNTYGPNTTTVNDCSTAPSGMFADSTLSTVANTNNWPSGTGLVCYSSGTAWAAQGALSTASTWWCVDSIGKAKLEGVAMIAGATACL